MQADLSGMQISKCRSWCVLCRLLMHTLDPYEFRGYPSLAELSQAKTLGRMELPRLEYIKEYHYLPQPLSIFSQHI